MSAYGPMLHVSRKNVLELCQMMHFLQRSSKISNSRLFSTCKRLHDEKKDEPDKNEKIREALKKAGERKKASLKSDDRIEKIKRFQEGLKKKELIRKLGSTTKDIDKSVPGVGRELLKRIQKQQEEAKLQKTAIDAKTKTSPELNESIRDLLKKMKKPESAESQETARQRDMISRLKKGAVEFNKKYLKPEKVDELIKLFEGEGFGVFPKDFALKPPKSDTKKEKKYEWESLWDIEAREQLQEQEPFPVNAFEEMIRWTNEGKMWKFPINNDQGWKEEENVEFFEHVFLDEYLEDFPRTGPIRHFMELVVTGLSKNPHISVQEKLEHIEWFREYFTAKEDLLKEGLGQEGVMGTSQNQDVAD
ncbi:hypothetical protein KUTeg_007483 [Tegillarca granosa]|uniref:Small ribosomal subunit protein mS31 n=1 Tax=Tegillarca granosa TaxID=220873 RepID=A0ABQ9FDE4_TEGGR|nr:hypothetical protein KUTeg_007483 [Tegillarca granosa]